MPTIDSIFLRDLLKVLIPGLKIEDHITSGQRVVYFAFFQGEEASRKHINWGKVVLKVTEELSPRQIAYLQKEIDILNSLNSPHYPKLLFNNVYSRNPISGEKFEKRLFVTIEERLNAKPLSDLKEEFYDERLVLGLLIKLVTALCLLWNHQKRLVHRDLKPENILINENGEVAIIDLGIIREEGVVGLTNTNIPWGPCSPAYASPEQAKNDKRNISFKSDFFSLGTLAYGLVTGENPFTTDPDNYIDEVFEKVITHNPPTLFSLKKTSEGFSKLIEKLMKKEPYQRHRTIDHLRCHLQAVGKEFK